MIRSILRKIYQFNLYNCFINKKAYLYFKNCQKILDIGCGTGNFIKNNPQAITGLDNNKQTIRQCKKQGFNVKLGSAAKLPFQAGTFNGIYCSHVIEHLKPKEVYEFLKESARVLKRDGILLIRAPLLWSGFYNNLTHIKPYPPSAITRYLVESAPDTTFPRIKEKFRKVALHWRYNFETLEKNGYMLVLQKC